ncbi:MAG: hypothetical protein Q4B52_07365 [Tissierellia bacterium]|nr:hypothetical protein [Tissierellia bacterium]
MLDYIKWQDIKRPKSVLIKTLKNILLILNLLFSIGIVLIIKDFNINNILKIILMIYAILWLFTYFPTFMIGVRNRDSGYFTGLVSFFSRTLLAIPFTPIALYLYSKKDNGIDWKN